MRDRLIQPRSTRRPIRSAVLGLLGLSLFGGGCGAPQQMSAIEVQARPAATVAIPDEYPETEIVLVRDRARLRVGDSAAAAFSMFPKPRRAFEFFEDPPNLKGEFVGRGWEAPLESFSVILHADRVILAVYESLGADQGQVEKVFAETGSGIPLSKLAAVVSGDVRYRFWESEGQRLMVCAYTAPSGKPALVLAIGDVAVMDALRMSHPAATNDANAVRRLMAQKTTGS